MSIIMIIIIIVKQSFTLSFIAFTYRPFERTTTHGPTRTSVQTTTQSPTRTSVRTTTQGPTRTSVRTTTQGPIRTSFTREYDKGKFPLCVSSALLQSDQTKSQASAARRHNGARATHPCGEVSATDIDLLHPGPLRGQCVQMGVKKREEPPKKPL